MKTHLLANQLAKLGAVLALTLVAPASVPSSHAGPAHAQRACHRVTIKATIMCQFNYDLPGWEGRAIVSINGGEAKTALLKTIGTPPEFKKDNTPYGHETNTFTFDDGSGSITISGPWDSSWSGTPGLLDYYSLSKVDGGTGDYAGIAGTVFTTGPFLMPYPQIPGVNAFYIGEMYGLVRGLAD
jgi:hypothetical protein